MSAHLAWMTLAPLGDSAVVVTLGTSIDESTLVRVRSLAAELELEKSPAIVDVVPAYSTVTVFYDIVMTGTSAEAPYDRICRVISDCVKKIEHRWPDLVRANLERTSSNEARRVVEIPVCYGGTFGPDIDEVAQHGGVSAEEVASMHSGVVYDVHAVGFTPGFPYLAGLVEKLHTPRKATPRLAVPRGSVGIGGRQTGIYPLSSPGGWQLIGRTPRILFDVEHMPPALLRVGDRVKFTPISEKEFAAWS
jgi:inhibitor of KinA